jgi:hypothetical protein
MGSVERIAMAIVGVGMVTTLILPDRKTDRVIGAIRDLFTKSLGTGMATYRPK